MPIKPIKPSKAARNQRKQEQRKQAQLPSKSQALASLATHLGLMDKA